MYHQPKDTTIQRKKRIVQAIKRFKYQTGMSNKAIGRLFGYSDVAIGSYIRGGKSPNLTRMRDGVRVDEHARLRRIMREYGAKNPILKAKQEESAPETITLKQESPRTHDVLKLTDAVAQVSALDIDESLKVQLLSDLMRR